MDNYEYCVQFASQTLRTTDARVLDYGCGGGQIVDALRQRGITAFGCDVFYEGGSHRVDVSKQLGSTVVEMTNGVIPFPPDSFDLVINNQVMEHVENLPDVLREIHRVLKSGGMILSLFPDKTVWREGHCGIPFLHWFPKKSTPRIYYALTLRSLGLGYHTGNKSRLTWSRDFCQWLDDWTYYRSYAEIHEAYSRYFSDLRHIEDDWFVNRLAPAAAMPAGMRRWLARKLAGMVFVGTKRA